jgi:hypothetical protein
MTNDNDQLPKFMVPKAPFKETFDELCYIMNHSNEKRVTQIREMAGDKFVIIGPHLLNDRSIAAVRRSPHKYILWNFEQGSGWVPMLKDRFPGAVVWDYRDVAPPVSSAYLCKRMPSKMHKCLLFYGSMNDRRRLKHDKLRNREFPVVELFGVWGTDLRTYIHACNGVINYHFYPEAVYPILRFMYPLSNGIPCYCEASNNIPEDIELVPCTYTKDFELYKVEKK